MTMETTKVLEINLISAQGLKPPPGNLRRMQTYAVVWIDPTTKLRTRIDRLGSENPSWNDKFLFKVTPEFLSRETSGVSFEIYAVGCLRDPLIGTVRFLVNNLPLLPASDAIKSPSVIALQVRRPSGRFQGVLNIAVVLNDGPEFEALNGVSAIGYRDLMGECLRQRRRGREGKKSNLVVLSGEESSCGDSEELSDGADSTTSSSSAASTALRDWNSVRDLAGKNFGSDGGGLFCGLLNQRRYSLCFSDLNPRICRGSQKENR